MSRIVIICLVVFISFCPLHALGSTLGDEILIGNSQDANGTPYLDKNYEGLYVLYASRKALTPYEFASSNIFIQHFNDNGLVGEPSELQGGVGPNWLYGSSDGHYIFGSSDTASGSGEVLNFGVLRTEYPYNLSGSFYQQPEGINTAAIKYPFVVVLEPTNDGTLSYFDLNWAAGSPFMVISGSEVVADGKSFSVGDKFIVWTGSLDDLWDIYAYDTTTMEAINLTNTLDVIEYAPAVNGTSIVYAAREVGSTATTIKVQNIETEEIIISIEAGNGFVDQIDFNGNFIVYNEGYLAETKIYNLLTGEVITIPYSGGKALSADIYAINENEGYLTYYRNQDVFLRKFSFSPPPDVCEYGLPSASIMSSPDIVTLGDIVAIHGNNSTITSGLSLGFTWGLSAKPSGSSTLIADPLSSETFFTPDIEGTYDVMLTVDNGYGCTDQTIHSVNVLSVEDAAIETISQVVEVSQSLTESEIKNINQINALSEKIEAVNSLIQDGKYPEALKKINNDILAKTNGCANIGEPDKNDWIESCDEQDVIYDMLISTIVLLEAKIAG